MRRLLAAAVTVLAVAACGGATSSGSGGSSAPADTPASGPTVTLADYTLQPATLSVAAGTTIEVVNTGKAPHNLWIRDASGKVLAKSSNLAPGQRTSLKLDVPPGSYTDYCQEPGHESLGMKGALTVT